MEQIEVKDGAGIIELLFDGFASCLVIQKALAVNWPDCKGSIGEYYSISDHSPLERDSYTTALNTALATGNEADQWHSIKHFLSLFANGTYQVSKSTIPIMESDFLKEGQVRYADHVPANQRFFGAFYPAFDAPESTIYSKTNQYIQPDRVAYYTELIKQGNRPTILTVGAYQAEGDAYSRNYLLDGHHKVEAYLQLQLPILRFPS